MKADVYLNLHKSKSSRVYSIRSREKEQRGKVVGYSSFILLENCKFVVSESGRKKVVANKSKLVHAVIRAESVISCDMNDVKNFFNEHNLSAKLIGYCPYTMPSFCILDNEKVSLSSIKIPIETADFVALFNNCIYALNSISISRPLAARAHVKTML